MPLQRNLLYTVWELDAKTRYRQIIINLELSLPDYRKSEWLLRPVAQPGRPVGSSSRHKLAVAVALTVRNLTHFDNG